MQGYLTGTKPLRADGFIPWDWLQVEWEDSRQDIENRVNPWEITESLLPTRVLDKRAANKMRTIHIFCPDDLLPLESPAVASLSTFNDNI